MAIAHLPLHLYYAPDKPDTLTIHIYKPCTE